MVAQGCSPDMAIPSLRPSPTCIFGAAGDGDDDDSDGDGGDVMIVVMVTSHMLLMMVAIMM